MWVPHRQAQLEFVIRVLSCVFSKCLLEWLSTTTTYLVSKVLYVLIRKISESIEKASGNIFRQSASLTTLSYFCKIKVQLDTVKRQKMVLFLYNT